MTAYYNEIDPFAAQWLRNLINAGLIAPGEVDTRSIEDVAPSDLSGFVQCHFFAGVGVWSHALRLAGWPDDRQVWTGSCPCQPFSSAGKGNGFDDERHLWPHFQWLIQQCKPAVVLGEQVASKDADAWIDLVHADLEAMGYAFGCVPFPAASIGAPHIRDRNYWVANSSSQGLEKRISDRRIQQEEVLSSERETIIRNGNHGGLAYAACERCGEAGCDCGRSEKRISDSGESIGMADTTSVRCGSRNTSPEIQEGWESRSDAGRELEDGLERCSLHSDECSPVLGDGPLMEAGPVNGFWRDSDWLHCRDGKWRPVEPGTFPLAHGITNRVGRLRAYGNAINAEQAKIFIEIAMECIP